MLAFDLMMMAVPSDVQIGSPLTPTDLAALKAVGISESTATELARIRRVSHQQAHEHCGIKYKSDHLEGIAFVYRDPHDDRILGFRVRRDNPEVDADGSPVGKYLSSPDRRHLYFAPNVSSQLVDTSVAVIVVEAEKSVLAIRDAEATADRASALVLGVGGCWGWRGTIGKGTSPNGTRVDEKGVLPDFDRLTWSWRDTVICFDANAATNGKVKVARRALALELQKRGANVRIAEIPVEPGINGPDDYIGRHGAAAFFAVIDDAKPLTNSTTKKGKESQATTLVRLVTGAGADLWHTPTGDGYITIVVNGHREHSPIGGRPCRDHLTHLFYAETGTAPSASALQDALATLSGMARFDGRQHDVHVRVGGDEREGVERLYLDLCDPQWNVVEIDQTGWRVTSNPPLRFRRPRGLGALPIPQRGGSITELREFLNVASDDDLALVVAAALAALRPQGPFPVIVVAGEQGSAKSSTARAIRRLIDPSVSDVRALPREPRDLMVAATAGHIVSLDNISHLPDWLSDALCRLATGGGFSTRQLFTDQGEVIFDAMRPVILNGITSFVTRGDLLDRALVLTLPVIRDDRRRTEEEFWLAYNAARPRILGALLDAVAAGLRRRRGVRLEGLPRMADFAIWAVATESACPWPPGTFLAAYAGNCLGAIETTLDGDVLADTARALAPWTGTATDLLVELNQRANDDVKHRREWFSKPKQVGDALRRIAPALRRLGIEVTFRREPQTGRRLIDIASSEGQGLPASPSPPSSRLPVFRASLVTMAVTKMPSVR